MYSWSQSFTTWFPNIYLFKVSLIYKFLGILFSSSFTTHMIQNFESNLIPNDEVTSGSFFIHKMSAQIYSFPNLERRADWENV